MIDGARHRRGHGRRRSCPRVFDAFFTTREGGTGLGLPDRAPHRRGARGDRVHHAAARARAPSPPSGCRLGPGRADADHPPRRGPRREPVEPGLGAREERLRGAPGLERPRGARRGPPGAAARAHPRHEAARHGRRGRPRRRARAASRAAGHRRDGLRDGRRRRRGDEARGDGLPDASPSTSRACSRPSPAGSSRRARAAPWRRLRRGRPRRWTSSG